MAVAGKSTEQMIKHIARRLHKTVVGALPPIPVSGYAAAPETDGTVFRHMFAVGGTLQTGSLHIEEGEVKDLNIEIQLDSEERSRKVSFSTKKYTATLEGMGVEIQAGDRLTVRLGSVEFKGIWISLLLEVTLEDAKMQQYLIDALDQVEKSVLK